MAIAAELEAHVGVFWSCGGAREWQLPCPFKAEEDGGERPLGHGHTAAGQRAKLTGRFFYCTTDLPPWATAKGHCATCSTADRRNHPFHAPVSTQRNSSSRHLPRWWKFRAVFWVRNGGVGSSVGATKEQAQVQRGMGAHSFRLRRGNATSRGRLPNVFGAHQARGLLDLHGVAEASTARPPPHGGQGLKTLVYSAGSDHDDHATPNARLA